LNIWDITDFKEPIRTIEAGCSINQICFNPKLQWVAAATENGVKVWDLMNDSDKPIGEMNCDFVNKSSKSSGKKVK
jgi:guanine nucleotide-binding protein subunit beta-2-like 1 protein